MFDRGFVNRTLQLCRWWYRASFLSVFDIKHTSSLTTRNGGRPIRHVLLAAVLLAGTVATSHAVCPGREASVDAAVTGAGELANAAIAYEAHMGELPVDLDALAAAVTNARSATAGPFLTGERRASARWYDYARDGSSFRISAARLDGELMLTGTGGSYAVTVTRLWCGAP